MSIHDTNTDHPTPCMLLSQGLYIRLYSVITHVWRTIQSMN
jgi:hypothetical protein